MLAKCQVKGRQAEFGDRDIESLCRVYNNKVPTVILGLCSYIF